MSYIDIGTKKEKERWNNHAQTITLQQKENRLHKQERKQLIWKHIFKKEKQLLENERLLVIIF